MSAEMLHFLHSQYIPFLKQNFSEAFLVGSLNYGPFYAVQGPTHTNRSDIDLFLMPRSTALPSHLGVGDHSFNIVDIDTKERFYSFQKAHTPGTSEFLNYRVYDASRDIEISVNLGSIDSLRTALDFRASSQEVCKLHRTKSMGGVPSIIPDLSGQPFAEAYTETPVKGGYVLELPRFTPNCSLRRFSGLAAMFTPKTNILFSTQDGLEVMETFKREVSGHIAEYRKAGIDACLTNAHARRSRFSPIAKRVYDAEYK